MDVGDSETHGAVSDTASLGKGFSEKFRSPWTTTGMWLLEQRIITWM